ncbi:PREDICTED: uncharacterized protein LOC105558222 [Vollenhovia emeryi]|uniref:uncharacterized protein LOC105558222 n=1 Tax=Vollenhovia emeryi TaxID=411798 RepID=UPI0005F40257|nr:PREDICTED: uncharacterized protein LOC105558222 [Vollenhovia emeryi]
MRKAKAMTGNKSIKSSAELSELELRVVGIIGAEYIEGNKECAENIAEEEENEAIHGNSSVLMDTEQINVCNILPQENLQKDYSPASHGDRGKQFFLEINVKINQFTV